MTKGGFVSALCRNKDSMDEIKIKNEAWGHSGRSRMEYYGKLGTECISPVRWKGVSVTDEGLMNVQN